MELVSQKSLEGIKTIAFYLQPGVEVLDFAGPMEVFAYAGHKVFTVSKTREPIMSQGILKVTPDYSIDDAPHADIVAFFGGNADNAYEDQEVIAWVKNLQDIEMHFSVCTGALVLAEAGLLDGKTATTFHGQLNKLTNDYPQVIVKRDVRFVDNGTVITTAGVSAGIDGALHLVARLQGLEKAERVAFYMEYDKWKPGEGLILTDDNPYAPEAQH
jgi:transcriptional regulator GlxA family with amidase domain